MGPPNEVQTCMVKIIVHKIINVHTAPATVARGIGVAAIIGERSRNVGPPVWGIAVGQPSSNRTGDQSRIRIPHVRCPDSGEEHYPDQIVSPHTVEEDLARLNVHVSLWIVVSCSGYKSACEIGVKTEDETIYDQREISTLHGCRNGSIGSVRFSPCLASIVARTAAIAVVDAGIDWYTVLVNVRL